MNKPFLLMAGFDHYPSYETGDWIARFNTLEEAESVVHEIDETKDSDYIYKYNIDGQLYGFDWYKIVDLNKELV